METSCMAVATVLVIADYYLNKVVGKETNDVCYMCLQSKANTN